MVKVMRELLYPNIDFKSAKSNYKLSYNPIGYMVTLCTINRRKRKVNELQ
jgi:hypothetical protein